jgi:PST family polysaccharide transporter
VYFGDNKAADGHSRAALRGGAMALAARLTNALIQIGTVLSLARLLTPEDYGLVGMVTAITGFAPLLVDLGSRDAIVQRSTLKETEVSALFWISLSVGTVIAVIMAACGPMISGFYNEPRLTPIVVVCSSTFVISALMAQHYALMRRAMMFREIGVVEVTANLLGAVLAIVLALVGFSYWALVIRPLAVAILTTAGIWMYCRWVPSRGEFTSGVKEMLRFGLNLIGFTMTDFVAKSTDRVAIGYRLGAASLGFYQNALFVYDNLLEIIVFQLHGVGAASLSKLRHDLVELKRLWAKALTMVTFFSMPAFGLLAVTGSDLVRILLGSRWAVAGSLLSILALRGIPHSVERTLGWLHVSAGRTDRWMRWGIVATIIQLAALFFGLPYGPKGVAIAYVLVTYVIAVPALAYAGRPLGIHASDVVHSVWRPFVGSLLAAALGFALHYTVLGHLPGIVRMAAQTITYVGVYVFVVVGVLGVRGPLTSAAALVADLLPARFTRLAVVRQSS